MTQENDILRLLHRYGITDMRRCVLLIGAGLSSAGVLPDGTGLPTWSGLTNLMLDDLLVLDRIDSDKCESFKKLLERNNAEDFLDIASYYKEHTDQAEFDNFFRDNIDPPGLRQSIIHEQIVRVGFRAIITTNFDRVFEIAAPRMPTYSYPDFIGRADILQSSETFLLKIHGSITPPINLKSRLRISREDYEELHNSPEYLRTLKNIIAGNPVIAIGYGCQDPDFISVMKDLHEEHSVGPFVHVLLQEPDSKLREELRYSNIKAIPYEEYGEIADFFDNLVEEAQEKDDQFKKSGATALPSKLPRIRQGMLHLRTGAVPSGSLALDLALGTGGWPRGHIVEIFGRSGSGKTSLVMQAIAEAQKTGGNGALIDADHATDPMTATRFGVDISKVYFVEPHTLEEAWETLDKLISDNLVDVAAIDSIAALVPASNTKYSDLSEKEQDTYHRNLVNGMLQKLKIRLSGKKATVLMTNQLIEKVGVIFGNPETTPFPTETLAYYASIRCWLRRLEIIKSGSRAIGSRVRLYTNKNRFSAPFVSTDIDIYFDSGLPIENEVLTLGLEHKILKRQGEYYIYKNRRFSQGKTSAVRYLKNNPRILSEIRQEIIGITQS